MKKFFFGVLSVFILIAAFSCQGKEEVDNIQERADSFATHYFNWQYEKCLKYVTPESKKYLQLAASNVTEGNVELLRSLPEDANVEIEDVVFEDDKHVEIDLTIHNYLAVDTIGRPAKFLNSGEAKFKMVKDGQYWLVKLPVQLIRTAYQQQSGQQDPDQDQDDK